MLELFERALEQAPHSNLRRHVTPSICTVSGVLRLHGRTPTYYLKQLATHACFDLAVFYGLQIVNDIDVI